MKRNLSLTLVVVSLLLLMQSCKNNAKVALINEADSINYAYGVYLGDQYVRDLNTLPELNRKVYLNSFKNVMLGEAEAKEISSDSAMSIVTNFVKNYRQYQSALHATGDSLTPPTFEAGKDYDKNNVSKGLASYIAYSILEGFKELPCGFNKNIFAEGFIGAFNDTTGKSLNIDIKQSSDLVDAYQIKLQAEQMAKTNAKNAQFLEQNKAKEGVQVTEDGLQYRVINKGKALGKMPKDNNKVKVHYTGKLIDGTVFDSSIQRGEPATFGVNQVIPGWTEALKMMKEGAKWELVIPPALGYGERGAGNSIPPNSVLIFEVELLEVLK